MRDTFRKEYKSISDYSQKLIISTKESCEKVEKLLRTVNSREMSLALTNLEQACMWAIKAIVLDDELDDEKEQ